MNEIDTLNDLLNSDLSNTPTSFPVLKKSLYQLHFEAPEGGIVVDTKAHDGGKNMVFKAVLESPVPAQATDGRQVQAGFSFMQRVFLPRPGADEKSIAMSKQKLAQIKLGVTGSQFGSFGDPAQYLNIPFTASVSVKNDPEYGESNEIAKFLPKKS